MYKRTIGIVGGLGPLAGAHFYRRLVELAGAASDAGHPRVVLIADPDIPNRMAHLAGGPTSPVPALQAVVAQLAQFGAQIIVVPSITTHAYYREIEVSAPGLVLNMLDATVQQLAQAGWARPALLVTTATRELGHLEMHLRHSGLNPVLPDNDTQKEIQQLVEAVKGGAPVEQLIRQLAELAKRPWSQLADGLLVGCTDISPIAGALEGPVIDVGEALARAALCAATAS